jgi:membrane associated rhomboid family serine protease
VTLAIAAATAFVWFIAWGIGLNAQLMEAAGFSSLRIRGMDPGFGLVRGLLSPLTGTLAHVDFWHLLFNMLMLLFCGRSIEPIIGSPQFALLYILGAYGAVAAHLAVSPDSAVLGVGASGAVSAALGAYAILFGRRRMKIANPKLATALYALWLLAAWTVLQLILGLASAMSGRGIAVAAHIGGFIVGLLLAQPLLLLRYRRA